MQSEMRVVSGDVKERADILKGQIDGAESRFQVVITELQKERATQRQRLETELQAIHRLINFSMQQALHRGLKSAVAAVDALSAAKKSGRKARGTTASLPILNRASHMKLLQALTRRPPVAQHSASATGS
jgi:hypothetical protein